MSDGAHRNPRSQGIGLHHSVLYENVCPPRTPGALGINDAADPNAVALVGATAGPTGRNGSVSATKSSPHKVTARYGSIRILDPKHFLRADANGTITVAPNVLYENAVIGVLDTIVGSQTGKTVVDAIAKQYGWDSMMIVPYEKTDINASATMLDPHGGRFNGVTDRHISGTGVGSSTVVQFSPSTWDSANPCHAPGALADEILIHEMFHGLRQLKGLMHHKKVGQGYDNEEEFFAILIANIYTSEKYPDRPLRANHHGFKELTQPGTLSQTKVFLGIADNRKLVDKLVFQQESLCDHIALVSCAFNPIRAVLIEGDALN